MNRKLIGIVSVALSAAMLTSCGIRRISPEKKEVKTAVNGFFDAAKSGDVEAIDEYIANDIAAEYVEDTLGLTGLFEGMLGDTSGLLESDTAKNITGAALNAVAERITYRIDDVSMTGDNTADVSLTMQLPDFENADLSVEQVYAAASEVLGVDVTDEHQLAELIMARTGLSAEELKAIYADMNQSGAAEQLAGAFEPELIEIINRIVSDMASDAGTETEKADVKLEKQSDGSWKIIGME